jgi:hypothetical protein
MPVHKMPHLYLFLCKKKAKALRFVICHSLPTINTRFAWAGGTFFLVVLYVVSVFGSGGKKVLVQICMYYLEYNKVVVGC